MVVVQMSTVKSKRYQGGRMNTKENIWKDGKGKIKELGKKGRNKGRKEGKRERIN